VFLYLQVVILATELIAPPIGSALLKASRPQNIFLFVPPLALLGLVVIAFVPETLKTAADDAPDHGTESNGLNLRGKFVSMRTHVRDSVLPLLKRRLLFIGLMALFVNRMSRPILSMMLQYMSAKFHWKIEKVTEFPLSAFAHGTIS
jgi:hypothetical protein